MATYSYSSGYSHFCSQDHGTALDTGDLTKRLGELKKGKSPISIEEEAQQEKEERARRHEAQLRRLRIKFH